MRLMTLMVKPVISDVSAARARSATTFLENTWRQVAAGVMLTLFVTSLRGRGGSRRKRGRRKEAENEMRV